MNIYFIPIILFGASCFPGSYETLIVFPQNTAVLTGTQVTLTCTTNSPSPNWMWWSSTYGYIVYYSTSCSLYPSASSELYSLYSPSTGTCNLIIKSASSSTAGLYTCEDLNSGAPYTSSAVVTVLESGPTCSIASTSTNNIVYSASNALQMECHVSYSTSNSFVPQLTWFQRSGLNYIQNDTFAYSVLNTSLTIPQTSSETCILNFNQPTGLPSNYATNTPTFTSSCNTPVLYPMYCPLNILISQSGNTMSCSAQSNPPASYQWFGPPNGTVLTSAANVETSVSGTYTCVATNTAVNCWSASYLTINSDVSTISGAASTMLSNPPPSVTAYETNVAAIVLGIFLGISVVVIFVLIFVRMRHVEDTTTTADEPAVKPNICEPVYENTKPPVLEYESLGNLKNNSNIYQQLNIDVQRVPGAKD